MSLFDSLFARFSVDMGIDLGTCNTLVCIKGQGIVLNEPTVVAVKTGTKTVMQNGNAVGAVAKEMLGRTPKGITAIRPLKDGVISDFEIAESMLRYFIRRAQGGRSLIQPRVVIAVPSGITAVEKRAVLDSAERAGARRVFLVDEPMAAAIGAGLPVTEPTASMIIDIGGGTTEVAIISLADVSAKNSVSTAGDEFDEAIVDHMKKTYNMMIGPGSAERVKLELGSACSVPEIDDATMDIGGLDLISGLPRKTVITAAEVREALQEPITSIVKAVTDTLEKSKPELAADLVDNGITMAGGSSLLRGLSDVIANATGLKVNLADDPLTCVARGTSVYLENLDMWKDTLDSDADEF